MKNKEFENLLRKAAMRLPTSSVIMARILDDVELQKILKKGGTGKPIIIIYGPPGAGKTSSVKALLEEHKEIKFAYGLKCVKKVMEDMLAKDKMSVLLIDNFPNPLSLYKLEAGRRIMDYSMDIVSENAEAPLLIITGEPNILEELKKAEYLVSRSLIIKMPKIKKNDELYDIRSYFSLNRQEYLELWNIYDQWAEHNPPNETEILQELENFRQKYCIKYENRQVGLVFNYYYALHRFSKFMESEYGEGIPLQTIQDNVQELFSWEESSKEYRSSYEIDVWNEFLEDGGITNVAAPEQSACPLLLKMSCDNNYQCQWCDEAAIEKYDPMDLRLPEESAAAILIENAKLIPDFPKHIAYDGPLLMIRSKSLVEMLNTYLENYSRKKGISVRRITPKKLTKELFAHNLCLFEYVGIGHNTYTFRMKDRNNENTRVIFIKLTAKQYQQLKEIVKSSYEIRNYDGREVSDMKQCIKYFCENVQSLYGDIGMPSMVLDEQAKH